MARFVFRLQRVKQVRTIQEDIKKQQWAEANRVLLMAQQKLADLKQEKTDVLAYCNRQADASVRPLAYLYIAKLERMISRQIERVQEAAIAEAAARREWLWARTEKEKLERLEAKHYEEFSYEQLRKEQRILDDMKNHLRV
ncbi:MAG: flagellar export protein FliJ [Limnochordia bacterium]